MRQEEREEEGASPEHVTLNVALDDAEPDAYPIDSHEAYPIVDPEAYPIDDAHSERKPLSPRPGQRCRVHSSPGPNRFKAHEALPRFLEGTAP